MERFQEDSVRITSLRDEVSGFYPGKSDPLPGTALKLDDQVMWFDFAPTHVVWGYDTPDFFIGYCPEIFGDTYLTMPGEYITDRAPVDPSEPPMPIFPPPEGEGGDEPIGPGGELQGAPEGEVAAMAAARAAEPAKRTFTDKEVREAIRASLKAMPQDRAKQVREHLRQTRPDLLTGQDAP